MSSKKGVLTHFIIIGIVIVILFSILFFMKERKVESTIETQVLEQSGPSVRNYEHVVTFVESCITTIIDNNIRYGITYLPYLIESELPRCTNFNVFQGLAINHSSADAEYIKGDEDLTFYVEYPLTILDKDSVTKINKFRVTYPISRIYALSTSSPGHVEKEMNIVSPDGNLILNIPAGTYLTDNQSQPLDAIELTLLDNTFSDDTNLLFGITYNLTYFRSSNPVTLSIRFNRSDIQGFVQRNFSLEEINLTPMNESDVSILKIINGTPEDKGNYTIRLSQEIVESSYANLTSTAQISEGGEYSIGAPVIHVAYSVLDLHTISEVRRETLQKAGFDLKETVGYIYPGPKSGATPLFRFTDPFNTAQFYSSDIEEKESVDGYFSYDGIEGALPQGGSNTVPIYRILRSDGSYFLTTDQAIIDEADKYFRSVFSTMFDDPAVGQEILDRVRVG